MEGVSSRRRKIALWASVASAIVLAGILGAYFSGNRGYALGTESGTESGYANGYGHGYNDGHDSGYQAGYDAGAQTWLVPRISWSGFEWYQSFFSCDVVAEFYLVNVGSRGFAEVTFTVDGQMRETNQYFVPNVNDTAYRQGLYVSETVPWGTCYPEITSVSIQIVRTWIG